MIQLLNFLTQSIELQLSTRNWRNQENVSKYFKIKNIEEEIHKNWLKSLEKEHPQNIAFFIQFESEFIGVTYFHSVDYINKSADWGMYISKEQARGLGIGKQALEECIKYAKEELQLEKLYLDVSSLNLAAINLYERIGFKFIAKEKDGFLRYEKDLRNEQ